VAAAIFGLIGVIVGGVLNGAITAFLVHRRESAFMRLAARELFDDLTYVAGYINVTQKDGDWIRWANALNSGKLELAWQQRRAVFAQRLRFDDFTVLSRAIRVFEMLRDESPRTKERAEAALTEEDRERFRGIFREVYEGLRVLKPFVGIGDPFRLALRLKRLSEHSSP
jgi:hypothetical protein